MNKYLLILLFNVSTYYSSGSDNPYKADFIEFWNDVHDHYAYFDKKQCDWDKVKTVYLPQAEKCTSRDELVTVFEHALAELYDDHFSLNTNLKTSPRLVPSGIDVWAEYVNGKAIITEVRKGYEAEEAGLHAGMEVVSIDSIPVDNAVEAHLPRCMKAADIEANNYILRQLLAGSYLHSRVVGIRKNNSTVYYNLDTKGNRTDHHQYKSKLEFRKTNEEFGYIKLNNSIGDNDVIPEFDSAVNMLKDTRAMIIDMRETPSGGNTTVARAILSRFCKTEMPYQKHVLPSEEKETGIRRSWLELVTPRGKFIYDKPVIVLADHWTGSMGEGITIGFVAVVNAKVAGTIMARLRGSIEGFRTSNTKIPYSFPTEQLFEVNGKPREDFVPVIHPDMRNDSEDNDIILKAAIDELNNLVNK